MSICHVPAATDLLFQNDIDIPIRTQDGRYQAQIPKFFFARLAGGNNPVGEVTISSTVSREAFDLCVCHCQGKSIDIPLERMLEMLRLTFELNLDEMDKAIKQFRNTSNYFLALDILESSPENIRDLEEKLADTFLMQIQNPIFLEFVSDLGLDRIKRVLARNEFELIRKHLHDIFEFMVLCVDKYFGNDAAVLFENVAMDDLNIFEILTLTAFPRPGCINRHRMSLMNRVTGRMTTPKRICWLNVFLFVCVVLLGIWLGYDEFLKIPQLEREIKYLSP